ncbi:phage holin family protein [Pseudobutyrivibrio sp.]|uniref:phage holin family protein n=1 Tax=Pseudobutyrivibrio sp. TaxID=2014367 RepID=UPI001B7B7C88|nr:phage holin family protein [Pseudobutyrivibrio sp.]MBP3261107.1 phage holin family protein [Pseudobutyrivibrio sp.]
MEQYLNLIIILICLCLGYILKSKVKTEKVNDWIPLIMGLTGVLLAVWINGLPLTPEILLQGLLSGLASTGCYELFKNLLEERIKNIIEGLIK